MEFFHFYLDAWKFCRDNSINMNRIKRNDWTTWVVVIDEAQEV